MGARLPAIVSTLLTIVLTSWIAGRRFGPEGALWAGAMVATMPLVIGIGKIGTIDALLAVHVLAVIALDIAEPDEVGSSKVLAMGALLGMAFLAKGPVGIVLPAVVVLAGRLASGRGLGISVHAGLLALAGVLAIVMPWGLAFVRRVGFEATREVLDREVVHRVADGTSHGRPAWFYLGVLFVAACRGSSRRCGGRAHDHPTLGSRDAHRAVRSGGAGGGTGAAELEPRQAA